MDDLAKWATTTFFVCVVIFISSVTSMFVLDPILTSPAYDHSLFRLLRVVLVVDDVLALFSLAIGILSGFLMLLGKYVPL